MTGALEGLIVADFSRVLAGPYATMMLADLGAEVIKVEHPRTGDDTRSWGPPYDQSGMTTYFASVNRNKRSLALDLTTDSGRERALELISGADILVENFRVGGMEKLGLGYPAVRADNPGLIYCSITGFGRGAGAAMPGYDLLVQAVGGLMSVTGPTAQEPTKVGVALVDVLTGTHALAGILAALHHRDRTGEGQRVDLDLLSVLLSSMVNQASAYLGAGVVGHAMGNRHPSISPYEVYPTADRPVALAVGNDRQFDALVDELGLSGLAGAERFATNAARVANRDELTALLSKALSRHSADEWFTRLNARGVPIGQINDIAAAFEFAESLGLRPAVAIPGSSVSQVANPIRLSVTPVSYRSAPPRLGE